MRAYAYAAWKHYLRNGLRKLRDWLRKLPKLHQRAVMEDFTPYEHTIATRTYALTHTKYTHCRGVVLQDDLIDDYGACDALCDELRATLPLLQANVALESISIPADPFGLSFYAVVWLERLLMYGHELLARFMAMRSTYRYSCVCLSYF